MASAKKEVRKRHVKAPWPEPKVENFDAPLAPDPALVAQADLYLSRLPVASWGRSFDVNSPERRHDAATWLVTQMLAMGMTSEQEL